MKAPLSPTNGTAITGTPKSWVRARRSPGPRGPRAVPAVEVEIDGDGVAAALGEQWRNVAHPDVIDRRGHDLDLRAEAAQPSGGDEVRRRQQRHRLVLRDGADRRLALDPLAIAAPLAGWTAQAMIVRVCGSKSAGMRIWSVIPDPS